MALRERGCHRFVIKHLSSPVTFPLGEACDFQMRQTRTPNLASFFGKLGLKANF
jgi:hypothetical protein